MIHFDLSKSSRSFNSMVAPLFPRIAERPACRSSFTIETVQMHSSSSYMVLINTVVATPAARAVSPLFYDFICCVACYLRD